MAWVNYIQLLSANVEKTIYSQICLIGTLKAINQHYANKCASIAN